MRKNNKKYAIVSITAMLIILSLLLGGCATNEPPTVEGYVVQNKIDNTKSVEIDNGEIAFSVTNEMIPQIKGYSSHVIDSISLFGVLISTEKIPYTKKIENGAKKLSKYGLDKPESSVQINYSDETGVKVLFGKKASDFEYYAMIEDDSCVYKVPKETYDALMKHPSEYRSKQVCSLDDTSVENFTISKNGVKEVSVKKDEDYVPENEYQTVSYLVTYPYENKVASLATLQYLFENISDITAESIVEEDPKDLSVYGLSPAAATITITDSSGETTIHIGDEKDDKFYLMCDEIPVVYLASSDMCKIVKELNATDYIEKFIGIHNIADVNSVEIIKGEETHAMEIASDGAGATTYKVDGETLQEKEFKLLYQSVIAVSLVDIVNENPAGEVYAKIVYNFKDSSSAEYTYYDYDKDYCSVKAKNDLICLVKKADIDALVQSFGEEN